MKNAWQEPPSYGDSGGYSTNFAMPSMTPMVKRLIIVNVGIFLVFFLWSLVPGGGVQAAVHVLGLSPDLWKAWFPFLPLWQLVTAGFLHAYDSPMHVLLNMLVLYFLGGMLEGIVGSRRFLVLYFVAMVAGWVLSLAAKLALGMDVPSIGASGAVLGVTVACAVLQPNARIIFIIIPLTLKSFALIYVGIQLLYALQVLFGSGSASTDFFAHLGGAAYGYVAVRRGWIWHDPLSRWEQRIAQRQAQRRAALRRDEDHRMDELLERIHKHGMNSLSERDRAFLKRVSKRQ